VRSFDLSGKGGPTSSYATAGIALWIIAPRKLPYPAKDAKQNTYVMGKRTTI